MTSDKLEVQVGSLATKIEGMDTTMTEIRATLSRMEANLPSKETLLLHIANVEQKNEMRHQKNESTVAFISKALWSVVCAVGMILLKSVSDFITRG